MIKTPEFWNRSGFLPFLLWPLSILWLFGSIIKNIFAKEYKTNLPVICIGNLTAGGTGKTPVTAFLYDGLKKSGYQPVILTRGYGAGLREPIWADPTQHCIGDCGDEALMLAESRDVLVAPDRVAGARIISDKGLHDVILMDDGMQNPFIAKTLTIGVFDGSVGIGNGLLIPAGPLRTTFKSGIKQMNIALINGKDETNISTKLPGELARFCFSLSPNQSIIRQLENTPVLAFAGIGQPKRFFATVRKSGCNLVHYLAFADHHPYKEIDLVRLQEDATRHGAQLITTQKDWVRLPNKWRDQVIALPVALSLEDDRKLLDLIITAVRKQKDS